MAPAQNSKLNQQQSGTQGGGSKEKNTLFTYFKPTTTIGSNRSHDVQELERGAMGSAAKLESKIGAVANSESQASGAVTVEQEVVAEQSTRQEEKESIFKTFIISRFFQIPAEARVMDRVTKSVYAEQDTRPATQPLGIRMLLKRLKYENLSDEDARKMAVEYIDQRIFAANAKIPLYILEKERKKESERYRERLKETKIDTGKKKDRERERKEKMTAEWVTLSSASEPA